MRAVVQRVSQASVSVDGRVTGAIDEPGLMVLVGVTHTDTPDQAAKLAAKLWGLLSADTRKGRRPSWRAAAPGPVAEPLVDAVVTALRGLGAHVETGVFGANMKVQLTNHGPVTIVMDL